MGDYNITNSESILEILYRVRILGNKKATVGRDMNQHRNTIMRICNFYEDLSDECINNLYERNKNGKLTIEERDEIFCRHMKEKLRALDKREIAECCKKHLNCNLSSIEYAQKLCKIQNIPFDLVVDYNPDKINIGDYFDRRNTKCEIQSIRRRRAVPKNYEEVYYLYYIKTKRYTVNPISLSLFKKYLKKNEAEFWKDKKWIPNLGKCIDTKK